MERGTTWFRPRWMPRPVVLLALGVVGFALTATVRVSQTTAPVGWATVDAEAVPAEPGTQRGRHRMQFFADGGDERYTLRCPVGGHEIGEIVPIAYDPVQPTIYKPLVQDRMWLVGALGGVTAAVVLTGLVVLSMPPAPPLQRVQPRRAIL